MEGFSLINSFMLLINDPSVRFITIGEGAILRNLSIVAQIGRYHFGV